MDTDIEGLVERLHRIEDEIERKIDEKRQEFRYRVEARRVIFEEGIAAQHRQIRTGTLRFLRTSPLGALVTAPLVYALVVPLAALDFGIWLYQGICFTVWGIPRVRRNDHIVLDRHQLAYLNGIEKLNCVYCGYANGVIAMAREVASRSEQYWCPIKHALRIRSPHARYRRFLDYGDADGFRDRLEQFRKELAEENHKPTGKPPRRPDDMPD